MNAKDRFIREKERKSLTGISRTTAWRLEKEGNFPRCYKLVGGKKNSPVGWKLSEIEKWIEDRCAANQAA